MGDEDPFITSFLDQVPERSGRQRARAGPGLPLTQRSKPGLRILSLPWVAHDAALHRDRRVADRERDSTGVAGADSAGSICIEGDNARHVQALYGRQIEELRGSELLRHLVVRPESQEAPVRAEIHGVVRTEGEGPPDVVEHLAVVVALAEGGPLDDAGDVVVELAFVEVALDAEDAPAGAKIDRREDPVVMPLGELVPRAGRRRSNRVVWRALGSPFLRRCDPAAGHPSRST